MNWTLRIHILLVSIIISSIPSIAISQRLAPAGTVIINGGDRGKSGECDQIGDVIAIYDGYFSTSNIVQLKIEQGYGLMIIPMNVNLLAFPGREVCATYILENTGNGTDSIHITSTGLAGELWPATTSVSYITLPHLATGSIDLKVQVPTGAIDGASGTFQLTASSSGRDTWGDEDIVSGTLTVTVDASPPIIHHTQTITHIGMLGNKLTITSLIIDISPIENVMLEYGFDTLLTSVQMALIGTDTYSVDTNYIIKPGTLTYKIYATDGGNGTFTGLYHILVNPITCQQVGSEGGTVKVEDGNPVDGETQISIVIESLAPATVTISWKDQQEVPSAEANPWIKGDTPVSVYDFTVSNEAKIEFATITLLYLDLDEDGLEDTTRVNEMNLRIFHWSGTIWEEIGGVIDHKKNIITARVPHLSLYGVFPVVREDKPKIKIITPNDDGINDYVEFYDFEGHIKIYDITGRLIRTIENTDRWDGRDDHQRIVESGVYIYQFKKAGKIISGMITVAK